MLAAEEGGARVGKRSRGALPLIFSTTAFSSAVLVFLVQPMVGKMLLPLLGGAPAVWNTCMVFYQAVLLAGYLYAHLLTRYVRPTWATLVHAVVLLLPLAALPIAVPLGSAPPPSGTPVLWLLGMLTLMIGVPFFVASTTAPLLQRWLSTTQHPGARDPYWLYAASNSGSLVALLGYPFVVEPLLGLSAQARLWTFGYALFAVGSAVCAVVAARCSRFAPRAVSMKPRTRLPARVRGRWVFLAFVPSSLMLGVTQHLSTDVAAVPLLWVVPLAIYLTTFVLAFGNRRFPSPQSCARLFPGVAIAVALCFQTGTGSPMAVVIPVHLLLLFVVGQLCHGRLGEDRPAPEHLTEFYLLIALGGVLGGVFNALVAPLVFNGVYEYPLALVLASLVRPVTDPLQKSDTRHWSFARELGPALLLIPLYFLPLAIAPSQLWQRIPQSLVLVPPAFVAFLFAKRRIRFVFSLAVLIVLALFAVHWSTPPLRTERSFFGVQTVKNRASSQVHILIHGNTIHGIQSWRADLQREPLSYYVRGGPLSQVLAAYDSDHRLDRIAIVGLGTGSMAAYGRRGQQLTFYEIDPAIIRVAQDPRLFTFISQSEATTQIVAGDGRLNLARAAAGAYDLIIVDGFSSDSIPVHLLTKEAVAMYFTKLRPGGLLLVHTSNRYFELSPVLAAVANNLGLAAVVNDHWPNKEQQEKGGMASQWIVLGGKDAELGPLRAHPGWQPLRARPKDPLWTDEHSNVLAVFRWWTSAF